MMQEEISRCSWVSDDNIYRAYHDNEWGVPVRDDKKLYEMLLLECFQAGLSWLTILKKREYFRQSFDNFDVQKISEYDDSKVNELLQNKNIIRNKNKILAASNNARVFIKIQSEFGSFANYIWSFTNNKIVKNIDDNIPVRSDLSDTVSLDLKKRGMKFVGSVTIYSYLQAVGIINDHEKSCFKHQK